MDDPILRTARFLHDAKRIAVLSGAGASAESGVPTFRASDGLWEGHRIEDVASPEGFRRNPQLVWDFYNARRATAARVVPNPGHLALAELETLKPGAVTIVTQNVDGLHQRAGSTVVHEVHGCLRQTRCNGCGDVRDRGHEPLEALPKCPDCGHLLRPDIVWFGEMLPTTTWNDAQLAVVECDVLLVIGTSSVVWPAAGLVQMAKARRQILGSGAAATVIEVNIAATAVSDDCDLLLQGPSGQILPRVVEAMHGIAVQ
jgi:NAD-dependent deacetylase